MKSYFSLFLRGIPIGISLTVPGVSGGTVALVLGIYDRLILAIKKINIGFLLPVVLGGVVGVWFSSGFITYLLDRYPNPTLGFLLGLVIFSAKVTVKEAKRYNIKGFIALGVSVVLALALWSFSKEEVVSGTVTHIHLFLSGFISSIAMLLPGISGATILIMLGLYGGVLEAIKELNYLVITIYALGGALGIFSFSWVLSYLLKHYRDITMMILTGLIIGSARAVIPQKIGIVEITAFLLGGSIILILSHEGFRDFVRGKISE